MGIKAIVDTLDDIEEPFRTLYSQQGDKFVLTGVEGVKPVVEFDRVYSGLTKERSDHKETKTKLQQWSALGDLAEVQARLDRVAELEAAAGGKLDETAINKLVETRIGSKTAPLQRELDQARTALAERDQQIAQFQQERTQRTIHDHLREALKKHEGFQASAFDDAAMLAERMLTVDEDGRVVTKEGVGVTPGVDAAVWLTEMQQKRPHWWGPSAGGGARGAGGGGAGSDNPWTATGWNLTKQAEVYRADPRRADQLARAAGTTIGGARPQAK